MQEGIGVASSRWSSWSNYFSKGCWRNNYFFLFGRSNIVNNF